MFRETGGCLDLTVQWTITNLCLILKVALSVLSLHDMSVYKFTAIVVIQVMYFCEWYCYAKFLWSKTEEVYGVCFWISVLLCTFATFHTFVVLFKCCIIQLPTTHP